MKEVLDFVVLAEAKVRLGGLDELPGIYAYTLEKGNTPELTLYGELGGGAHWRVFLTPASAFVDVMVPGGWFISKQIKF